jgi:anti-sigma factor RsiW
MGCREWGTELTDWALGELSPAKAQELEWHLGQCVECARSAQRLRAVRQALRSSLTDREMPAHLVFVGEKPLSLLAGFWTALLRTAALSAAAAAIFLVAVSVGFRQGRSWVLPATARVEPALSRTEMQDLIVRAAAAQASLQSKETQAAARDQLASLRQEEMANWVRIAQHLQFMELALNTEWKETQKQNEAIRVVAHYQQPPTGIPAEPSRR